jgi:hypothetical protein
MPLRGRTIPIRPALAAIVATLPWLVAAVSLPATADEADDEPVPVLTLDGRLDEPAWSQARVFRDFVVTEPFTLAPPTLPTEARLLSTPDGIAIGFDLYHPPEVPRVIERTARDADQVGDRVNVYIDFDADGQVAFNFTVGLSGSVQDATWTNEVAYSADWDGDWRHAVHVEDDRWSVEILIPWTVASMRGSGADTRTIAVLFDRYLAANRERSASAPASFRRPRYVSEFTRVEIDQYAGAVFEVYPYVTAVRDLVGRSSDAKAGADLFWKPSGDFQLTAALNPDFGQVEADELVVNFEAIEAFQSDKRPFFTENQGIFDLRTPDSGLLIYTRRIGGPRDDDPARAADIDAALKLNGAWRGIAWGTLAAVESEYADDIGSAFLAQRLVRPGDVWTLGYLATFVDRPFLDRRASVNAVDATWRPDPTVLVSGQVIDSRVDHVGASRTGTGAWIRMFLTPSQTWQHELELTRFTRGLDFNDMGFLRRADLEELEWTTTYLRTDYAEDDPVRSSSWRIEPQIRRNTAGDLLPPMVFIDRGRSFRDGASLSWQARIQGAGIDDLVTRGHGKVRLPPRHQLYAEYDSPRLGNFEYEVSGRAFQEGLDDWALAAGVEARWIASERLSLNAELVALDSPDWLIWRRGPVLGQFERTQVTTALEIDWFPAADHEFRAKMAWVGLRARNPRAWRAASDASLLPSDDPVDPFALNSVGIQLRYRWTFAPQSDLFVVYGRGGERFDVGPPDGLGGLFVDALGLRDVDQFLVKVRWRI